VSVPLFDISQPTPGHQLKKLREAGLVDSEARAMEYYYVDPRRVKELSECGADQDTHGDS